MSINGPRPSWIPESTGELRLLGTMPNGNQIYSNYAGRVEEDGTIIITTTAPRWSWKKFRHVSQTVEIGEFRPDGNERMGFSTNYDSRGPLDFEVRNADGNVITPRYRKCYAFGR